MSEHPTGMTAKEEEMERMRAQVLALQQQLSDLNKAMKSKSDGGEEAAVNSGKIRKPPKNKASTSTTDDWTSGSDFDEEQDDKKSNRRSPTFEPKRKNNVKKGGESTIKSPIITRRRSVENIGGEEGQEKSLSSRRKRKGESLMPEVGDCKKLINYLMRHKFGPPFNQPVDPVALGIPDYFNVIKNPMDLRTISEKMNEYETAEDFAADLRLVWSNALLFNPPDHEVYMMAKTLSDISEKKLAPILKKAAAHSSPREPKRQHTDVPQSMTLTIGPKTELDGLSLQQKITQEISDLCVEIDSVKKQISTLKQQLAAGPPVVAPPKAVPVQTEQPPDSEPPTREEKAELMMQMRSLSEKQVGDVLHILHANANTKESDEIEIDMEGMDVATFRKFQAYVRKCLAENAANPSGEGTTSTTTTTTASTEEQQTGESKEGNESAPSDTESDQEKQASTDAMQTESTSVTSEGTHNVNTSADTTQDTIQEHKEEAQPVTV